MTHNGKSKELRNSINALALWGKNTKTKLESLGDVELKYISSDDARGFEDLLWKELPDRKFTVQILFYQLVKPRIDFNDFEKISDQELEELGIAFVKNEGYTFKYFQDTGNFFRDFKKSIVTWNEKHIEEIKKTFAPIIKSTQETLKAFDKNYFSIIQQALDGTSYVRETLQEIKNLSEQLRDTQFHFIESFKPIIEQYRLVSEIIKESLRPQIDFWQRWAEINKSVFQNFSKYWTEFQQIYSIAEQKAVKVLQKYKWFITPSFPMPFILDVMELEKKKDRQDKSINKLFVNYFEAKNWQNLEMVVCRWKSNPLFKKRYKIITDCVEIIKLADKKGINGANIVLPTLITQIDGILTDFLNSKGISWDCDYDDWVDSKSGKVKRIGRKTQFKNTVPKILTTQFDDLASDIFLNILFQKSQKGKPLATPFNFNRHKIIHGENIKYGRKDYLIRAFMIIDFLAHLK